VPLPRVNLRRPSAILSRLVLHQQFPAGSNLPDACCMTPAYQQRPQRPRQGFGVAVVRASGACCLPRRLLRLLCLLCAV
jgi:hypothetical protein